MQMAVDDKRTEIIVALRTGLSMGPGIQALNVHVRDRWYVTLFLVTYFYTRHYYPNLELRRLNSIRHYLSQDALKLLISAFVLSRIDYCNHLYSLAVLSSSFTNFKKVRTTLQGSSVELLSLTIHLPSFTLFTGFLLNKELNTNCFPLPSNM